MAGKQTIERGDIRYTTDGNVAMYTAKTPTREKGIRPGEILYMDGGRATHQLIGNRFVELYPHVPIPYTAKLYLDQARDYDYWDHIELEPVPTRLVKPFISDEYLLVYRVSCAYNKSKYFCVYPGTKDGRWWNEDQLTFITDISTIADEQLLDLVVGLLDD